MLSTILFDLDGTIANTDPIHYQAWREILLIYGIEVDEHFYQTPISGRTNPQIVKEVLPQLPLEAGEKLADEKELLFRRRATQIQPLTGFLELAYWIKKHQ